MNERAVLRELEESLRAQGRLAPGAALPVVADTDEGAAQPLACGVTRRAGDGAVVHLALAATP